MEFVKLNGFVEDNEEFISMKIKNGDSKNCIGDQVWISSDGTEMEIYVHSDTEVLEDTANLFEGNSKRAFKGALRRMGVEL
jgi:hypothetical protein